MNAGFRNLLGRRDTTRFKAYLLAIAVQMLLLPILQILGLGLGYIATEAGALKTLRIFIQSLKFDAMTLGTLLDLSFWSMSVPLASLLIFFLQKNLDQQYVGISAKVG